MVDYKLSGLNPRDFEHLIQSLGKGVIAVGLTPFGDGPDGGREATFEGPMRYPSEIGSWDGYLVVQCKFKVSGESSAKVDGQWAIREMKKELALIPRRRKRPDAYLFVTNVRLTAVEHTGFRDRAMKELQSECQNLGITQYDIWAYDDLCRYIDANHAVRLAYGGFITPGDVLEATIRKLGEATPSFLDVMSAYQHRQLLGESSAKLESAGQEPGQRISLADVFVDLPAVGDARQFHSARGHDDRAYDIVHALIDNGSRVLRPSTWTGSPTSAFENTDNRNIEPRTVLVGGPGQGKSTIAQYVCQLYRSSMLLESPSPRTDVQTKDLAGRFQAAANNAGMRIAPRFPFKVVLNRFASDLAADSSLTLIKYMKQELERAASVNLPIETLRKWLEIHPWVVVLDGLDEVPAASNRESLLDEISAFCSELVTRDSDTQLIATTRPQSYQHELRELGFFRHNLVPLEPERALAYGEKLVGARWPHEDESRTTIQRRLKTAAHNSATAKLMQSPLQVTIMATLVEKMGEPPRERYRLFEAYYRTIYGRETGREGVLATILSQRKTDIDSIHFRTGLSLQIESESAGKTDSQLTDTTFTAIVTDRLEEIGMEEAARNELVEHISDSSLDRLVFLTRPRPGVVGFEIRSLQEFMAAEALMHDGDQMSVERMTQIATNSFWRNVLLFCIGKVFVAHDYMLDSVLAICTGLNAHEDPVIRARLAGSLLALDILGEGSAQYHPKMERQLALIALETTTLSEIDISSRLVEIHNSRLDDLFHEHIEIALRDGGNRPDEVGALAVVIGLASKGIPWAQSLWDNTTPEPSRELDGLLLHAVGRHQSEWLSGLLRRTIPGRPPFVGAVIGQRSGASVPKDGDVDWLRGLPQLSRVESAVEAQLNSVHSALGYLEFQSIFSTNDLARLNWIETMPMRHIGWRCILADFRLRSAPSTDVLATELRGIAEMQRLMPNSEPDGLDPNLYWFLNLRYGRPSICWLLLACVASTSDPHVLEAFAASAEKGLFGEPADWREAEQRWFRDGVTVMELGATGIDIDELPKRVASGEFPLHCAELRWSSDNAMASAIEFLDGRMSESGTDWLGREVVKGLFTRSFAYFSGRSASALTLEQIRNLYHWAQSRGLDLPLVALCEAMPRHIPTEWLPLLDEIARGGAALDFSHGSPIPFGTLSLLSKALAKGPQQLGLVRILAMSHESKGRKPRVPAATLRLVKEFGAGDGAAACAVIELSAGKLTLPEAIRAVTELRNSDGQWMPVATRAVGIHSSPESKDLFARAVLAAPRVGERSAAERNLNNMAVTQALESRQSGLAQPLNWDRLKLRGIRVAPPKGPHH